MNTVGCVAIMYYEDV